MNLDNLDQIRTVGQTVPIGIASPNLQPMPEEFKAVVKVDNVDFVDEIDDVECDIVGSRFDLGIEQLEILNANHSIAVKITWVAHSSMRDRRERRTDNGTHDCQHSIRHVNFLAQRSLGP